MNDKAIEQKNNLYISLGSNIGDRMHYLQSALDLIDTNLGEIDTVSPVYQSKSIGFKGADFLNACALVSTKMVTEKALLELLQIEKKLGRKRSNSKEFQSRTIDLDILFSSEGIIDTLTLQIPHPRLIDRKFVLLPLSKIAPKLLHPVLLKTITQLLAVTPDQTKIQRIKDMLVIPN